MFPVGGRVSSATIDSAVRPFARAYPPRGERAEVRGMLRTVRSGAARAAPHRADFG